MAKQQDNGINERAKPHKNWAIVRNKTLWTLLGLALCHHPAAAQSVHVLWGYTPPSEPSVTSFKFYQDGTLVATMTDKTISDGNKNKFYVMADGSYAADVDVTLTQTTTPFTLTAGFADGTESPHSAPFNFTTANDTTVNGDPTNGNIILSTVTAATGALTTVLGGTYATTTNGGWVSDGVWNIHNSSGENNLGAYLFTHTKTTGLFTIWKIGESGTIDSILAAQQITYGGLAFKVIDAVMNQDQTGFKALAVNQQSTGDKIDLCDIAFDGTVSNSVTQGPFPTSPNMWTALPADALAYNPQSMKYSVAWAKGLYTMLGLDMTFNAADNSFNAMYVLNPPETNSFLSGRDIDSLANNRWLWKGATSSNTYTKRVCISSTEALGTEVTGSKSCFGPYTAYTATNVPLVWDVMGFYAEGRYVVLPWRRPAGIAVADNLNRPALLMRLGTSNEWLNMQLMYADTGYEYVTAKTGNVLELQSVANSGADKIYRTYSYNEAVTPNRWDLKKTVLYYNSTGTTAVLSEP